MSTETARTLILASSSPRRQELIRSLPFPVHVQSSDADETTEPGMTPEQIVETLSLRKAAAVARILPDELQSGIVIGSDTIVVLDGRVLGKPVDEQDAERMLSALQGREHHVYSGLACLDAAACRDLAVPVLENHEGYTGARETACGAYRLLSGASGALAVTVGYTVSRVKFKPMSPGDIAGYIQTKEPMDKAGGYGVQGLGAMFVERLEGDFYSVMGLPVSLLHTMLAKLGLHPFSSGGGAALR
ncbi:Maf family protein [Paenibacillus sp. y28]|uniref:Maf family protein n=1 Tax=Paenibacillus sp. y28 TaxID=3129110 RepID=UPI0030196B53